MSIDICVGMCVDIRVDMCLDMVKALRMDLGVPGATVNLSCSSVKPMSAGFSARSGLEFIADLRIGMPINM